MKRKQERNDQKNERKEKHLINLCNESCTLPCSIEKTPKDCEKYPRKVGSVIT